MCVLRARKHKQLKRKRPDTCGIESVTKRITSRYNRHHNTCGCICPILIIFVTCSPDGGYAVLCEIVNA